MLEQIYEELMAGESYGEIVTNCRYPHFHYVLWKQFGFFHWNHYGSSANKATVEDLRWIIEHVFKMTAEQFAKTYHLYSAAKAALS